MGSRPLNRKKRRTHIIFAMDLILSEKCAMDLVDSEISIRHARMQDMHNTLEKRPRYTSFLGRIQVVLCDFV